jgi:hypothetical protein
MKIILYSLALSFFLPITLFSQTPSWHVLPNAPIADTNVERFDDEYFINSMTGWIVEGAIRNDSGKVYKTTDGGITGYSLIIKFLNI